MNKIQPSLIKNNRKLRKSTVLTIVILWAFTAFSFVLHTNRKKEAEEERQLLVMQFEELNKEMARAEGTCVRWVGWNEDSFDLRMRCLS